HPNIIGIKDTVDNISHIREIINNVRPVRPDFVIFSGYDEYMMGGAVVSGAYFGDKISPLSDSTNFAAIVADTTLFEHIQHLLWTT
ncbi:dihydrodipicolinate synthase family protein, partial [Salmonella enterica subsp. enterica serovar Kentucky]|nr:dihydrodipicolinate synthase family protein [Salmonella enterica subsp. enterica serovar Kentucky]